MTKVEWKKREPGPMDKACRLTKISGGAKVRTDTVEGFTDRYPEIGEQFMLMGNGLIEGVRLLNTSPIVSWTPSKGGRQIITESGSIYLVELL